MKPRNPEPSIPAAVDPERPVRVALGYVVLLVLPALVVLLVMATKFQGLNTPTAWDNVQLARHLAAGEGYVTSVVRPLSLGVKPRIQNHPELSNAPVHPLVLALSFTALHPSDKVAAVTGLALWAASVWLTFLVARRWFGARTAALATVFYGSNVAAVTTTLGGSSLPLLTLAVGAALCLAIDVCKTVTPAAAGGIPSKAGLTLRVFLAGFFCALAGLTEFAVGILAVVVGSYLVITRRAQWRTFSVFVLGFLLPWLPWVWWNLSQTPGQPFGLAGYHFLTNTRTFPAESIWRTMTAPPPFLFLVGHPQEMVRKLISGLNQFVVHAPVAFNPVVALLFAACLPAAARNLKTRPLVILTMVGLLLSVLMSCLLQSSPAVLTAWAPWLAIVTAVQVRAWVEKRVGRVSLNWLKIIPDNPSPAARARPDTLLRELMGTRYWGQMLVVLGVVSAALIPLLYYLFGARPLPEPWPRAAIQALGGVLPEDAVVMTDQPAALSWYTGRPAVALLQREADWARLDARGIAPTAVFITPRMPPAQAGDWWEWVTAPRGIYRGLAPVQRMPARSVLRMRPEPATAPELEKLAIEDGPNPLAAEAHIRYGAALLARDRLREALAEFEKASVLDPENLETRLGIWQTQSRLHDAGDVLSLAQRILQTGPRAPASAVLHEDLARTLSQTLAARPNDPWLLLTAATCDARLGRFDAVRARCERLKSFLPTTLPAGLLLGSLYLQQQHTNEAAAVVEPLVVSHPGNVAVQELLGQIRGAQGRWDEALQCYRTAQRLRPNRLRPYLEAGFIALRQRNGVEATRHFTAGARVAPKSLAVRTGLAEALTLQGKPAEAIPIYRELIAEYPQEPALLNNLAHLLASTGKDLDEAIRVARQAVDLAPRHAGVRDTLGWAYLRAGQPTAAIEQLQEAARLDPNTGIIRYHLGKALLAAGRRAEAETALRTALPQGLTAEEQADAQKILAGR